MAGPEAYELTRGGEWLAIVQAHKPGKGGYFWYSKGRNTAGAPPLSLDAAKAEALAYIRTTGVGDAG